EIFTMEEMIAMFELEKVNKAGAIFDLEKLNWMNGMYLRQMPVERLAGDVLPILAKSGFGTVEMVYAEAVVDLIKERITTLNDIPAFADYMFGPIRCVDFAYAQKHWKAGTREQVEEMASRFAKLSPAEWTVPMIEGVVRGYAEELGLSAGKLIHPLRLAITGRQVGAGMFETMVVLGQGISITRLREFTGPAV
ncbi:MAG: glutamate--tRNA ligase, partial [Bacteroidota bacterium]